MSQAREVSFFKNFRNSILALDSDTLEECELRVNFQVSSFDMIPRSQHEIIFNLTRSFPTPPVYAWLVLGIAGTNISRFCAIARPGCHTDMWERSGSFYNLIAESRLGKGIAMSLLWKLGSHIQGIRRARFSDEDVAVVRRPRSVFLAGGNGIQIHADAAANDGTGVIFVPEIKSGKSKYTNIDGSYGPLLSFYDIQVPGSTFRKAANIPDIGNCRIQVIAAGVLKD